METRLLNNAIADLSKAMPSFPSASRRLTNCPDPESSQAGRPSQAASENLRSWRRRWFGEWEVTNPLIESMLLGVEGWSKGVIVAAPTIPRILILSGVQQTGKTRLGKAVANYWRLCAVSAWDLGKWGDSIPSVQFQAWSEIANCEPDQRGGVWKDLVDANLAVIDDIGTEVDRFKSARTIENLRLMLEARLDRNKWTLITTNVPAKDWAKSWDGRVSARLTRDSYTISTWGCEPWRKKHA